MTIPPVALFNILACLGWSSVNVIVGAQLLAAINPGPHALPGWAGILIIALSTLFITTFGYRFVHAYERWSWIPVLIIFCIVAGEFGASGKFDSLLPLSGGKSEAGLVLSFAASVFGFATGWTSMAADYVRILFKNNLHPLKRKLSRLYPVPWGCCQVAGLEIGYGDTVVLFSPYFVWNYFLGAPKLTLNAKGRISARDPVFAPHLLVDL